MHGGVGCGCFCSDIHTRSWQVRWVAHCNSVDTGPNRLQWWCTPQRGCRGGDAGPDLAVGLQGLGLGFGRPPPLCVRAQRLHGYKLFGCPLCSRSTPRSMGTDCLVARQRSGVARCLGVGFGPPWCTVGLQGLGPPPPPAPPFVFALNMGTDCWVARCVRAQRLHGYRLFGCPSTQFA